MFSGDCSLLLMNWCFKVEECFTSRWYINNWEHSSCLSLAVNFSLKCLGMCREQVLSPRSCISRFNALSTLLLLWLDSRGNWAGIYLCENNLSRMFIWPDAFLIFCTYYICADQLYSMFVIHSIIPGERDCDVRPGLWRMTLFGQFALFYHHQSCWYKFEYYINYCLAGLSFRQKSER